jgi:hypothetical protein
VLALGVSLHVSIAFSLMVGFFTLLMLTTYLAFLPPETARSLIVSAREKLRRRVEKWRRPNPPRTRTPGPRRAARAPAALPAPVERRRPSPAVRST